MTQEPLWKPKPLVSDVSARRVACAVVPDVLPSGCCEFATGVIHEVCSGRNCSVDGYYCPRSVFSKSENFADCSTRLAKLKERS